MSFFKSKNMLAMVLGVSIFSLCSVMTACNGISQQDYDDLKNQYDEVVDEKDNYEAVNNWLGLYNSIEMGKSFAEISAMFGFEYSDSSSGGDSNDGYRMTAYSWQNRDIFDDYHLAENQIEVVFRDDIAIFKQYGNQNFIMNSYDGTINFPFQIN